MKKVKPTIITILSFFAVIIIGIADHITGYEIAFSIFYLAPILATVWFASRASAIVISVLSAAAWLMADLLSGLQYSHYLIPIWNTLMRFAMFLLIVYFAAGFKRELEVTKNLSRTDPLTGLLNARYFYVAADIERGRAVRFNRPLAIAYIDIDNFKQVNDTYGHSVGDDFLCAIAKTIKDCVRDYDIVARLGGDEFAVIFPETNESMAKAVVERLQSRLLAEARERADFVTFSIGVAAYNQLGYSINEIIKEADHLMYDVKKKGKNAISYKVVK